MTPRELFKKLNGICARCKDPAMEDCRLCKECREVQRKSDRKRYRRKRRNNICSNCPGTSTHGSLCEPCYVKKTGRTYMVRKPWRIVSV